ncbi:MAG: penicillin-binding protein [Aggregatilineales bacterium]
MPSVAHLIRRRRSRKHRTQHLQQRNHIWTGVVLLLFAFLLILPVGAGITTSVWLYQNAAQWLLAPDDTYHIDPIIGATELVDRNQDLILFSVLDPLGDERRRISLDTLPPHVIETTLLAEDNATFLTAAQPGLIQGISNLWTYMIGGSVARDRTITGKLVENTLLPALRNPEDKVDLELLRLVFIAEINRRYSQTEILEWYVNTAYYGHDAYGIDAAAQVYLAKSAPELMLDEAALLAAIPPAPQFNPLDDETAARGRQLDLLRNLRAQETITQADFETASARFTPLNSNPAQQPDIAPHFSRYARQQAETILDNLGLNGARMMSRDGLYITTTLDLDLYTQSDCLMQAHLSQLQGTAPAPISPIDNRPCTALPYLQNIAAPDGNAANTGTALIQDVQTGEILMMIGDATTIEHEPGLTLYPFVYLQGFLSGNYTPATMLLDIPQPINNDTDNLLYTPGTRDGQYRGVINLRDAFAGTLKTPAALVADKVSMNSIVEIARRIGINSLSDGIYDLSLLERGGTVSLLDIAYTYSVFATGGGMQGVDVNAREGFRSRDPIAILKIEDAAGNVLWDYDETRQALSRTSIFGNDLAHLINDILSDSDTRQAILDEENTITDIGRPAAVMQGAAGEGRDSWTIGYTPQLLAAVHLGRDDTQSMTLDATGQDGAAPVWQALMRYTQERDALPIEDWKRPENVAEYIVCQRSGMNPPPGEVCPTYTEIFLEALPPFQTDTHWQSVQVNSQTGQLATANTAPGLVIERVYFVPPDAAMDWWVSNNLDLPPTDYDVLSRPEVLKAVQLFIPEAFDYVGGVVDIRGSIDENDNMDTFQLSYGEGLRPAQWFDIGDAQTVFNPGATLGEWDTTGLDGIYTLQLAATYSDGSRDTDFVQVTIDNIAPVLLLQAGEPGQIFRYPAETVIPIIAEVSDNLARDRVEFYHNGVLVATDTGWPFGFEFAIQRTGTEFFTATAFDRAGNIASTEIQVEIVRDSN